MQLFWVRGKISCRAILPRTQNSCIATLARNLAMQIFWVRGKQEPISRAINAMKKLEPDNHAVTMCDCLVVYNLSLYIYIYIYLSLYIYIYNATCCCEWLWIENIFYFQSHSISRVESFLSRVTHNNKLHYIYIYIYRHSYIHNDYFAPGKRKTPRHYSKTHYNKTIMQSQCMIVLL